MNIAITSKCNKGCNYCFAKESMDSFNKQDNNIMELDTFESILQKHNSDHLKLLGGEPTLHPQFEELLNLCLRYNKKVTLISNFLFNEKKKNIIRKYYGNVINSFLINSTDLDVGSRLEKFKSNYNDIYTMLYNIDEEHRMSCGLTIDESKDLGYYVNYINYLKENLLNIERMRISLNFPGSKDKKEDFYFLSNKNLGSLYVMLSKHLVDSNILPSCDCIIYPCMFENKEHFKYVKKFVDKTKTKCLSSPFDVFLDKSISYCYPLKDTIRLNFDNYRKTSQISEDLNTRYTSIRSLQKQNIPDICKKCAFYDNDCHGPCMGFYNLESINIGKEI